MKSIIVMFVFIIVSSASLAQEPSNTKKPTAVDYDCEKNPMFKNLCNKMQQEDQEAAEKRFIEEFQKRAGELKEGFENGGKVLSKDQSKQAEGAVGEIKVLNSMRDPGGNSNDANGLSTKITDQSLDFVHQYAQKGMEVLDYVRTTTSQSVAPGTPNSSSYSGQHELHENTGISVMEQAFQQRANAILSSPATVISFGNAERALKANMEEIEREQYAEKVAQAKALADYNKANAELLARQKASEEAQTRADAAQERIEQGIERRQRAAFMRQMYPGLYPPSNNSYLNTRYSGALNGSSYFGSNYFGSATSYTTPTTPAKDSTSNSTDSGSDACRPWCTAR